MATIVQTPTGAWQAIIRRKGTKPVKKTFTRKTDAERWAKGMEADIERGEYRPERKSERHTFNDLVGMFTEAEDGLLAMSPGQQRTMPGVIKLWQKQIGHMRLKDVTADVIEDAAEVLASRRKVSSAGRDLGPVSASTARKDLAILASVFKWAVTKRIIRVSPMREVAKPEANDARERYLSDAELHNLLDACDRSESPELGLAVRLALFTGLRQADVMGLQWGRVNLTDRPMVWTNEQGRQFTVPARHALVPVTKNGHPHLAPLEGPALDALNAWSIEHRTFDGTRLVFPGRHNSYQPLDLRTPWETVLRRAGIAGFRWHDLRHTFASWMLRTGISHLELAKLTGHKDLRSLMRYAHIAPEHASGLVERMAANVIKGAGR